MLDNIGRMPTSQFFQKVSEHMRIVSFKDALLLDQNLPFCLSSQRK